MPLIFTVIASNIINKYLPHDHFVHSDNSRSLIMAKAGKNGKKSTKSNLLKDKKKKRPRKLGLAKFINGSKKRKESEAKTSERGDDESKTTSKLTLPKVTNNLDLLDRCKLQMSSSILRLMDEKLYTSDTEGLKLNRQNFLAYHDAYSAVCEKWPTKPIDYIVKFIKKRLLAKKSIRRYTFADVGCGREPLLKQKLPPKARVFSFDLVSVHEDVIEANMDRLPIDDESVHCIVYSLSLMARNLGKVIVEAKRVMKLGASLLIVEVTSRFEGKEKVWASKLERLGLKSKSIKSLQPNGYFTFFHFSKTNSKLDYSNSCLNIELKPCVYKSR